MKPYYEQDGITIYHGDCLLLMAECAADAVISDPPYGVDFRGHAWDASIPPWFDKARAVAPVIAFTTGITTIWDYPRAEWILCWGRPASNSRSRCGGFSHWSPVLLYGKASFPIDAFSLHAIANSAPDWNPHPTPKPVKLYHWLIDHTTAQGQTVLDPFMGSGTTLQAAKELGRRAIGIEIEERYCEIAARRLDQGVLDLGPSEVQTPSVAE